MCLGSGPAPEPTLKKSLVPYSRICGALDKYPLENILLGKIEKKDHIIRMIYVWEHLAKNCKSKNRKNFKRIKEKVSVV